MACIVAALRVLVGHVAVGRGGDVSSGRRHPGSLPSAPQ